ncbi:hypothetical protein GS539_20545 [Rhodococcus hoagii]|nr:hypothetical protein [Prescottella equi]
MKGVGCLYGRAHPAIATGTGGHGRHTCRDRGLRPAAADQTSPRERGRVRHRVHDRVHRDRVAALLGGATHDTSRSGNVSHWAGLAVGLIFVAFGVGQLVRRRSPSDTGPEWMQQLSNAKPRGAFIMGAALSIVNPNLAIMISGTTVIAAADTTPGTAVFGTVLLLLAAALDFLVPIGVYLAFRRPCEERALRSQGVDDHARATAHAHCVLRFRRVVRGAERGGPDLTLRRGWCVGPPRTRASRRR